MKKSRVKSQNNVPFLLSLSTDIPVVSMIMPMIMPMTGNPDTDFAAMMIPHHQRAIEMAKIELQYGTDFRTSFWAYFSEFL
jgi:uncharacterized protein (DUF305 family)